MDKSQVCSGVKLMELRQANDRRFVKFGAAWEAGLPVGVRQADCEGTHDPLAEADANDLWAACDESQQESLSVRFLQNSGELLRDALLDVQSDSPPPRVQSRSGGAWLGEIVWEIWKEYRDRELRMMRRRGDIPRS